MECLTKLYTRLMLSRFMLSLKKEKGQGLVEYALVLVLIAIVCIVVLKVVGRGASNAISQAGSALVNQ